MRWPAGEPGFEILAGGGLGRMPVIGKLIRPWLPQADLLAYLEAILRIYNSQGRRDNIHKASIKVLVKALGVEEFTRLVEAEFVASQPTAPRLEPAEVARMQAFFTPPPYDTQAARAAVTPAAAAVAAIAAAPAAYAAWERYNTRAHRVPGYRVVFVPLKAHGAVPGDASAEQMDALADIADEYSFGQIRTTHDQNLVLADVPESQLGAVWTRLVALQLATPNLGTLTDMICCPGLDFCSLANAGSIEIARQIDARFDDFDYLYDLGPIELKMSGCMNACGHHHVGHIGILGVEKRGQEWYQITLGGSAKAPAALGEVIGPSVPKSAVAETLARILGVYVRERAGADETFIDTVRRLGIEPFREGAYATDNPAP